MDYVESRLGAGKGGYPGERSGALPKDSELPPFRSTDMDGGNIALEDYRGKKLFLVNWDPGCGFCTEIAPDLANIQDALWQRGVAMVFLAAGETERIRNLAEKAGLKGAMLAAKGNLVFRGQGTPAAYMVNEQGRIMHYQALGADQVLSLARGAIDQLPLLSPFPLEYSRRPVAGPGRRAPDFSLEDLRGRPISPANFRGSRLLLISSDPNCSACDQVAAFLTRAQNRCRKHNLELLMISKGTSEANASKARKYRLEFPIALQKDNEVAEAFGVLPVPAAFLIGPDGIIQERVALGSAEIKDLITQALQQDRDGSGKKEEHELLLEEELI